MFERVLGKVFALSGEALVSGYSCQLFVLRGIKKGGEKNCRSATILRIVSTIEVMARIICGKFFFNIWKTDVTEQIYIDVDEAYLF